MKAMISAKSNDEWVMRAMSSWEQWFLMEMSVRWAAFLCPCANSILLVRQRGSFSWLMIPHNQLLYIIPNRIATKPPGFFFFGHMQPCFRFFQKSFFERNKVKVANAAVVYITPYLMKWSTPGTLLFFGVLNLLNALFVVVYIKETFPLFVSPLFWLRRVCQGGFFPSRGWDVTLVQEKLLFARLDSNSPMLDSVNTGLD